VAIYQGTNDSEKQQISQIFHNIQRQQESVSAHSKSSQLQLKIKIYVTTSTTENSKLECTNGSFYTKCIITITKRTNMSLTYTKGNILWSNYASNATLYTTVSQQHRPFS